ncbi:hypothetical protein A1Q2_06243 [Trichosporon asahii var. asahii CBS 8904]|uniref:Uncharacterized protein n=1 Tax=Trichosporon asahii var. asahii (strain CBS 8904) TaxID=1220162 RepID=K1VJF5_TRIAC|nr:hypothetical protein A1Q2_06243 [Trichosporon asahii var. asahii CBS 8904]
MRLASAFVPLGALAATALGAAVPSSEAANPGGHFECTEEGPNGACLRWTTSSASAITFDELNKTVIVPAGTQLSAAEGATFESVSLLPGAVVWDGLVQQRVVVSLAARGWGKGRGRLPVRGAGVPVLGPMGTGARGRILGMEVMEGKISRMARTARPRDASSGSTAAARRSQIGSAGTVANVSAERWSGPAS